MFTATRATSILDIDLKQIILNWQYLSTFVAPSQCIPVVKANAYGLGAEAVAAILWRAGARSFFVATLLEGIDLRKCLPHAAIAVLNGLHFGCEEDYVQYNLIPVLNHLEEIKRWSATAQKNNQQLQAFLHFDTGMNRLGIDKKEAALLRDSLEILKLLQIKGHLSHFACAEEPFNPMVERQFENFITLKKALPPAPSSLCNSAGIFCGKKFHLDFVRPGAALYGLNQHLFPLENAIKPVIHWYGKILQIRHVEPGESIGYGATHITSRDTLLAVISAGYADGILRPKSNKAFVSIHGYQAPIVGRISMDLLTVDVTDIPQEFIYPGGRVEFLNTALTVDHLAEASDTLSYEVLATLGKRCLRQYLNADFC